MNFTKQALQNFIEDCFVKRGTKIADAGDVVLKEIREDQIRGYVVGSQIYTVVLKQKPWGQVSGTCSCPAFYQFGPCKHLAAMGFAFLEPGYESNRESEEAVDELLVIVKSLSKKTKDELLELVEELICMYPEVAYTLAEELGIED